MIVCHCHGITDREIRALVRSGANSAEAIGRASCAGSGCGGCRELIAELVGDEAPVRSLPCLSNSFLSGGRESAA